MAILQVAINPLLRLSGGEEHFAFNSVMAQLIFGSASFLSPRLYSYLVTNLPADSEKHNILLQTLRPLVPKNLPWVSLYWVFALTTLTILFIIFISRFPRVELKEEEKAGTWGIYKILFRKKIVLLYFLGIMAYVGSEQGLANWISQFLKTYHGLDPRTAGASAVSYFWGLMTVGCLLGLLLLKLIDSRKVLVGFSLTAIVLLSLALFGPAEVSRWAFPLLGFAASVMWSIIFSLALNSVDSCHGAFSGILCTGIIGGALVPLLIGWLGDHIGLRQGMFVLYLTLGYILSIGLWARPLITNKTIQRRKKKRLEAA
jgi:fucose permease